MFPLAFVCPYCDLQLDGQDEVVAACIPEHLRGEEYNVFAADWEDNFESSRYWQTLMRAFG